VVAVTDVDRNAATIERFYAAFGKLDGAGMEACYAPDVHFRDPVFGDLEGREAGGMWRMLTGNAKDLKIALPSHSAAPDGTGKANWVATYTFRTGRKVVNDINASFIFGDDGRIAEHIDEFDLYKWSRMALGPMGYALGWTPIVRNSIRRQAAEQLDEFLAGEPVGSA
jgi:ketosteroid isomerase-like protein